jgi:protein SCO1
VVAMNSRYKQYLVIGLLLLFKEQAFAGHLPMAESSASTNPTANIYSTAQTDGEGKNSSLYGYKNSQATYDIPSVQLLDKDSKNIDFRKLIDYGGPVMVQFVFATCSTVCPILSACFSSAQPELEKLSGGSYRLVSISIDPEQDTPERLTEYAQRFKAGKNWYFLTGSQGDIAAVLKAFSATYQSNNKMYHQSLTLMRPRKDSNWTRIEGLLGKQDFIMEYKKMSGLSSQVKK